MESGVRASKRIARVTSGKRSVPRHRKMVADSAARLERSMEKRERQASKKLIARELKENGNARRTR